MNQSELSRLSMVDLSMRRQAESEKIIIAQFICDPITGIQLLTKWKPEIDSLAREFWGCVCGSDHLPDIDKVHKFGCDPRFIEFMRLRYTLPYTDLINTSQIIQRELKIWFYARVVRLNWDAIQEMLQAEVELCRLV